MGGNAYNHSPWIFRGNALYQLNLVRSEEARKYVPEGLRLVEVAGWTLGGLYLARYSDSPAGAFDEMVVLAGLVWNAPTSCAWAARVYVDARAARDHGVRSVGLPSRLARFGQDVTGAVPERRGALRRLLGPRKERPSWWNVDYADHKGGSSRCPLVVHNVERGRRSMQQPVAQLLLPAANDAWGPRVKMSLPSFSGATPEVPGLLKYACQLHTRVKLMPKVEAVGEGDAAHAEDVGTILRGRPLICMAFDDMHMSVSEPEPYSAGGVPALA